MKYLLQTLIFFLILTQLSYAQLHRQTTKTNRKTVESLLGQQGKQLSIIGKNVHENSSNRFLSSDFQSELNIGFDTLDDNGTSNPFLDDRFFPNGHKTNLQRANKTLFPPSQTYVIDTAIVISEQDTTRHLYSFNASAKRTSDMMQKLIGGLWADTLRHSTTYDANNNILIDWYENWENGQWVVNGSRYTYTYDANNNRLSLLSESWENGQLFYSDQHTYTYDPNNNMLSELYEHLENGLFVYSYRNTYTYDVQGNILSYLYESWENGQWANIDRYTNTYDSNNNILSSLSESWENGQWVNLSLITLTYDVNNNMLSSQFELWENSQWVLIQRYTFTYDANNNRLSLLSESWENGQWVNSSRGTYTYDGQGNRLSELYESWENGQWVNSSRGTYTYDGQGNRLSELYEDWENGQWLNSSRGTYTYDANNNMLSELYEHLENGLFVYSYRNTYTYDSQGNRLSELLEEWENGQLVNSSRNLYTYDEQNNMSSVWHHEWQNSSWIPMDYWTGRFRFNISDGGGNEYYFHNCYNLTFIHKLVITSIEDNNSGVVERYSLAQNYPNPFNPSTKIKYSIPNTRSLLPERARGGLVTLKVYDLLGRVVATLINETKQPGNYEVEFNAAKFSSGVYFYRLKAGDFIALKKMVLIK